MQEIAGIPKIANQNSDFLTLQKLEFQKTIPTGIFGIGNRSKIPPWMGVPEIRTKNWNSQLRFKDGCKYLTKKLEHRTVKASQSDHPLIISRLVQTTPSTQRLIQKGTPRNLSLLQLPLKFIQRSVIIFTILGMFGTTMLCRTILDWAAYDDKPPVVHGNKKKMYHIMLFRTKITIFFLHMQC